MTIKRSLSIEMATDGEQLSKEDKFFIEGEALPLPIAVLTKTSLGQVTAMLNPPIGARALGHGPFWIVWLEGSVEPLDMRGGFYRYEGDGVWALLGTS